MKTNDTCGLMTAEDAAICAKLSDAGFRALVDECGLHTDYRAMLRREHDKRNTFERDDAYGVRATLHNGYTISVDDVKATARNNRITWER